MPLSAPNRPASLAEAKAWVDKIFGENPHLTKDELNTLNAVDPKLRKKYIGVMNSLDQQLGSSVIMVTNNIYNNNTRFVFELLQNTDDNEYSEAAASSTEPYVSFKIFADKIVLECNEDGFTKENLAAICEAGKSSKIGLPGYIGEKGIGFKSVFMAAYKVHIQSGHFSFTFNHRDGESGMGMISPVWEDPDASLSSGITRITLFLHDTGSALEIQNRHLQIVQQFQEIQDIHLLFLRKIRCIQIIFAHKDEKNPSTTTFKVARPRLGGRITLRKSFVDNSAEKTEETHYHVTRHTAYDLPKSENRTHSESVESSSASSSAEIIIAFPLDSNSVPIIRTQQIFAFLPIRDMGFNFLIHSDFVTQASRQDIVTTSARNLGLVNHIAITFANAMEELCQDTALQFEWIKYLPQDGDFPWDGYWKSVIAAMKKNIAAKRLMVSRSGGSLRRIDELRLLTNDALDDSGEPLLDDISPEIYPSSGYDRFILNLHLKDWGLKKLNLNEFLDRVEADLARTTSRLKSPQSSQTWHSRTAACLNRPFVQSVQSHQIRLRGFSMIPIQGGTWISAQQSSLPLVFPTVDGANIPDSLDLNIINKTAVGNFERRILFKHLGAVDLSVATVRQLIFDRYPSVVNRTRLFGSNGATSTIQAEISLSHIAFLYLTHEVADRKQDEYRFIRLLTPESLLVAPKSQNVYIKDDHKYGVKSLLDNLPKFSVAFLSSIYLEKPPTPTLSLGPRISWPVWLQESLGVLSRPLLVSNGALTDLFRHIIEHNSDNLIGILQHYWNHIKQEVQQSQEIRDEIGGVVLVMKDCSAPLSSTFLPLPELKARASEYLDKTAMDKFPFLDLSDTLEPDDMSKWNFLHDTFYVSKHDDVEFYLEILSVLASHHSIPDQNTSKKIYALYEAIYRRSRDSTDPGLRQAQQEVIQEYFQNNHASPAELVLVPGHDLHTWMWKQPSECRWNAPPTVTTIAPVAYLLDRVFTEAEIDRATLEQFLRSTLQIGDCTCTDLINELRYHATLSEQDKRVTYDDGHYTTQAAEDIYKHLQKMTSSLVASEKQKLVNVFKDTALIFAAESWRKTEDCLWSSATEIEGKVILNGMYPNLKSLFVDVLGVKTLTLKMAYSKLEKLGASNDSLVSEVRSTWTAFNSLLSQESEKPDPTPLRERRVFPVKYPDGHVELCSATSPFAIIDRKQHGLLFLGKAMILDYSFEEVYQLQATFKWAGLDTRFTSVAVKEVSAVIGGSETALSNPDRDLKSKAHGLCRIAAHYKSPRTGASPESLYRVLKNIEVFETDGISTQLHLRQGNSIVSVTTFQSNLHIDTNGGALRVYIPRDRKQQQLCYSQTLPRRLYDWIMVQNGPTVPTTESTTCVSIIMQSLTVSYDNIEAILEGCGIAEVPFPNEYEAGRRSTSATRETSPPASSTSAYTPTVEVQAHLTSENDKESKSDSDTYVEGPGTPTPFVLATRNLPASEDHHIEGDSRLQSPRSPNSQPLLSRDFQGRASPGLSASLPVEELPSSPARPEQFLGIPELSLNEKDSISDYTALLSRVVETARRSSLPHKSTILTTRIRRAVDRMLGQQNPVDTTRFYASNKFERDNMIGAAGELYVFELLCKLQPVLLSFGRENWMSKIRKYVTEHPDYSDMDPWIRNETTDIVYHDLHGTLTSKFIELGYLDRKFWDGAHPRYYIEVKTTIGPCETPFYMSDSQFRRMQATSNVSLNSPSDIYVIFRVSNLGSDPIDLAIYLDPECMRQTSELEFGTKTYSVTPGIGRVLNQPAGADNAPSATSGIFG